MRLWTVPFLLITVAATWLLAGVVFGPQTERQLAAAAVPALFPMVGFISGSINPDGLLYALWSVAFLLGARILVGRGRLLDLIGLLVVVGLAMATKAVSLALAPAVLLVLGVLLWRNRARRTLVTTVVRLVGLAVRGGGRLACVRQQLWGLRAASAPSGDLARQLPAQRLRELPVAVLPAQLAVPERLSPARGLAATSLRILDSAELGGLRLARGAMVEGGLLALGGGRPHGGHRGWTRHLATACSRQSSPPGVLPAGNSEPPDRTAPVRVLSAARFAGSDQPGEIPVPADLVGRSGSRRSAYGGTGASKARDTRGWSRGAGES